MKTEKITPLPWQVNAEHEQITKADWPGTIIAAPFTANQDWEANAAYIVRACNLYPELANALEMAIGFCEGKTVTTWRELGPILKAVLAKCKE